MGAKVKAFCPSCKVSTKLTPRLVGELACVMCYERPEYSPACPQCKGEGLVGSCVFCNGDLSFEVDA